ncbi:MAG: type II secretion system protein [Snowella sp.]|nr:type II secretion system protein [Snowella sp.]
MLAIKISTITAFYPLGFSKQQGWTLIELAAVATITGILAALATPSMMATVKKNQIAEGASQIKGALQDVQQQAMRQGKTCTATIANNTVTASPVGCISENPQMPASDITVTTANFANTPATIAFSFKGNSVISTTADPATIIVQASGNGSKKCVIISTGLGIVRSGDYSGTTCTPSL